MNSNFKKQDGTSLVKLFQTARLDEWIGDLERANERYEELKEIAKEEKETKGLFYIMEPVVKERKKKLEDTIERYNVGYANKEIVSSEVIELYDENREVRLLNPSLLKPTSDFKDLIDPLELNWKYSVLIASKSETELRLEVRGYNPANKIAKLDLNTQKIKEIAIISKEIEPDHDDIDLITINGKMDFQHAPIHISIDRWGLLSCTLLIDEEHLGDLLIHLHYLIHEIDQQVWGREN